MLRVKHILKTQTLLEDTELSSSESDSFSGDDENKDPISSYQYAVQIRRITKKQNGHDQEFSSEIYTPVRMSKRKQPYTVVEIEQEQINILKDLREKTSINRERDKKNQKLKEKTEESLYETENIIKKRKSEKNEEEKEIKADKKEKDNVNDKEVQKLEHHRKERKRTKIEETPDTITVGNYVIVKYHNKNYPGIVKDIDNDDYEVSVMERINEQWKWPDIPDQIWYSKNQIVNKISEPNPDLN
ncbi:hypothetical protein FQR65_LT13611 [Abscondita terminalis]|nr:hypothetical protein FQR65_LT13611 [Abscondita terminalis]